MAAVINLPQQDVLKRIEQLDQEAAIWKGDWEDAHKSISAAADGLVTELGSICSTKRDKCWAALQTIDSRLKALEQALAKTGAKRAKRILDRLAQMDKEAMGWKKSWMAAVMLNEIGKGQAGAACWAALQQVDARRQALEARLQWEPEADKLKQPEILERLEQLDQEAASWKADWEAAGDCKPTLACGAFKREKCWAALQELDSRRRVLEHALQGAVGADVMILRLTKVDSDVAGWKASWLAAAGKGDVAWDQSGPAYWAYLKKVDVRRKALEAQLQERLSIGKPGVKLAHPEMIQRLGQLDKEAAGWKAEWEAAAADKSLKGPSTTYKQDKCLSALQKLTSRLETWERVLARPVAGPVDVRFVAQDVQFKFQRLVQLDKEAECWKASWLDVTHRGETASGGLAPTCWEFLEKMSTRRRTLEFEVLFTQDRLSTCKDEKSIEAAKLCEKGILERLEQLDKEAAGWKAGWEAAQKSVALAYGIYERDKCWAALESISTRGGSLEIGFQAYLLGMLIGRQGAGLVDVLSIQQRLSKLDKEIAGWRTSWLEATHRGKVGRRESGPACWEYMKKLDARRPALEARLRLRCRRL